MHKITLAFLLIVLTACTSEEPVAQKARAESNGEQTAPGELEQRSARTADVDDPPPVLRYDPNTIEPTNYLEQAQVHADQQLSVAQEHCATLAAHLEDNCITSANVQHEAAMANARIEYERQLAEQAEEASD